MRKRSGSAGRASAWRSDEAAALARLIVGRTIHDVISDRVLAAGRVIAEIVAVLGGVLAVVRIADYTQKGGLIPRPCCIQAAGHIGQILPSHRIQVHHPIPLSWYPPGAFYWVTPWWAYALAVAVGLLGVALAVLIHRAPLHGVARHQLT